MALFTCKIGMADGTIQVRELEAVDSVQLRATLEEQGFYVFEIKRPPLQFLYDKGLKRRKVSSSELLTFNQELLVLLKAGLPILQILDTILTRRNDSGRLTALLQQIREDVKGGAALSAALERHGAAFPHLYLASIRAGERTGDLPDTIRRFIAFLKRAEAVRKKIISSLFYPCILIGVAVLAIALLLLYVVPSFSQIYADSGAQLPFLTRVLIGLTASLRVALPFMLVASVVAVYWYRGWSSSDAGRYRVDRWKLQLPLVGELVTRYAVCGFSRTMATLLGSGIPILESLRMSIGTLNNRFLERRMVDVARQIEEGGQLSLALERAHIMPPLALRMLGVGEATGALEEMLGEIADYLEDEVEQRLHLLTTAIEPAIMVLMGCVIGFIIVAMYLPVFKIAGTVG